VRIGEHQEAPLYDVAMELPDRETTRRQGDGGVAAFLLAAAVLGALACLGGAAALVSDANWFMSMERGDTVGGSAVGQTLLVMAETAGCLVFVAMAILALHMRRPGGAAAMVILVAVANLLWMLLSLAAAWKPGWYFILDPVRGSPARWLIYLSGAQVIAWLVAAALAIRRATKTAAPRT
jgi:hypothetical protein